MLTVIKWVTVGVSVLLTGLAAMWVVQLNANVDFAKNYAGMLDDPAKSLATAERNVVIGYVTLAAIALIGVTALLAGLGQQWARVLCTVLLLGPMGVIVYGVVSDGPEALFVLAFLVPFATLLVLWCLPGVSRGLRHKKAARMHKRFSNHTVSY